MALMAVVGAVLLVGLVVTWRWGGTDYREWDPDREPSRPDAPVTASDGDAPPSVRSVAMRYLRGVAIALVAGFWTGALVTGPAVRLVMRLLAVTAGDDAQGSFTEADEVVGDIDVGGTIALVVFGGVLPAMLSGVVYVVFRPLLPRGRLGGLVFGALHLVVVATRIDPLRPDNPDFDIVGPGWLSVATFGLASLVHGMAVVAIADRYSQAVPPPERGTAGRVRAALPLVPPAVLSLAFAPVLVVLLVVLVVTLAASRVGPVVRAAHSPALVVAGRVVACVVAVALLPGTIADLHDVVVRDDDQQVLDSG